MTVCGAPEAVQAAIAAGLLSLGSVFVGSLDNAARMLQEALATAPADADLDALAVGRVALFTKGDSITRFDQIEIEPSQGDPS